MQQEEEKGVEKDAEEVVKKTCKREAKQKEEVVIGAGNRHLVRYPAFISFTYGML